MLHERVDQFLFIEGVQVTDVDTALLQLGQFVDRRLVQPQHDVGLPEHPLTVPTDFRAGLFIGLVREAERFPDSGFDRQFNPLPGQHLDGVRNHRCAGLLGIQFSRYEK